MEKNSYFKFSEVKKEIAFLTLIFRNKYDLYIPLFDRKH